MVLKKLNSNKASDIDNVLSERQRGVEEEEKEGGGGG